MDLSEAKSFFEIDLGPNLDKNDADYEVSASERKAVVSFETQCETIKTMMSKEDVVVKAPEVKAPEVKASEVKAPEVDSDKELISEAMKSIDKKEPALAKIDFDKSKDIPDSDIEDDTDEDNEDEDDNSAVSETKTNKEQNIKVDENNPLDLAGMDFKAYQMIKSKYPQFILYDGSISFKNFYRWKLSVLKQTLTRFPVLDISSARKEIRETNLDHFIGEQILSPELIRKKIDDVYRQRVRLISLLASAYEQFPAWKRSVEMIRAKLFKDHDIKGVHKRDGIVLEHISDVEFYVKELEGFIDAAKMIYSVLDAASESLSRQLSCITSREISGIDSLPDKPKANKHEATRITKVDKPKSQLDDLDDISDGTMINKPTGGVLVEQAWSVVSDDDPLSNIG